MRSRTGSIYWILAALWLVMFTSTSQVIIVAPILPQISSALGVKAAIQGSLVSAYAVTLSVTALLAGPVSDKIGRRRILLYGSSFLSLSLLLHGLAQDYAAFLGVRALAGVGGGLISGTVIAYIGDYFAYERRGWATGWVMSGVAFGQVVGVPLGIFLAEEWGFRVPFLAFGGVMAVTFLIILRYVPQPDVELDEKPLRLKRLWGRYRRLLRSSAIRAAVIVYFLMYLSIASYVVYLPTWLQEVRQISGMEIAYLFFVGGLASVLAAPIAGKVSDRIGRKPIVITACLGLALLMVATPYLLFGLGSATVLFVSVMVLIAVRISPLQALLTALVSDQRRGMLMSFAVALGQMGLGIGGTITGPAYAAFGYASNAVLGAVAITAVAFVVWSYLPEPETDASPGAVSSAVR